MRGAFRRPTFGIFAVANKGAQMIAAVTTLPGSLDEAQRRLTKHPERLLQLGGGKCPEAGAVRIAVVRKELGALPPLGRQVPRRALGRVIIFHTLLVWN